jgi:hypothetical protein
MAICQFIYTGHGLISFCTLFVNDVSFLKNGISLRMTERFDSGGNCQAGCSSKHQPTTVYKPTLPVLLSLQHWTLSQARSLQTLVIVVCQAYGYIMLYIVITAIRLIDCTCDELLHIADSFQSVHVARQCGCNLSSTVYTCTLSQDYCKGRRIHVDCTLNI